MYGPPFPKVANAVSTAEAPIQIEVVVPATTNKAGETVTVAMAVELQPDVVPVTVYVVVVAGLAPAVLIPVDVAPALQV